MRLYLSSYRLGEHPEELTALVRGDRRGWIVANALDGLDEDRRARDTRREIDDLQQLGLHATDLDLRRHDPASIGAAFGDPDFVWVRGGNVFTLRAALARSGLDELLVTALHEDRLAYAGYSAGACVLAPSLAGLEHADPILDAVTADGEVRTDGLGILDRPVVPHLDSPAHPATRTLGEVAARYDAEGQPYWRLRDGQALVIDGARRTVR